MLKITLKSSDLVLRTIPRYTRLLHSFSKQLKVYTEIMPERDTVILTINATVPGNIEQATKLTYSCFNKDVVEIRILAKRDGFS
jgi:hypothetical protein